MHLVILFLVAALAGGCSQGAGSSVTTGAWLGSSTTDMAESEGFESRSETQDDSRPTGDESSEDGGGSTGGDGDTDVGGSDSTGDVADLDCEPQPMWYRPRDPLVTAPYELRQWRWIEVPGMKCANNTPGGFFVNVSEQERDLVIFFGGGGVCYDAVSCLLDTFLLLGMGPTPLETWLADVQSRSGIFDRNDPSNPFRDATFTFFPHCTGDGHSADKVTMYPGMSPIHQVGYKNVRRALNVIAPTFEHVERITVAGFSAGGIGSLANYHQIAWLFECLDHPPPLLIDDAGPVLRKPFLSDLSQAQLKSGWGLDATFADLCPACGTEGYHLALERIRELHPGARTSLVNAYSDMVVRQLYSAMSLDLSFVNDPNVLRTGLLDYASWTAGLPEPSSSTRHREFYYGGERHGALVVAPLAETPGLAEFLQAQLDDAPGWSSVHP